jgi:archaemetzincin
VLSSFSCHRGAKNAAHMQARFAKTAVHELGHSFGLDHCPTAGCIMHDGEGSVRTTDTEHDLCAETRLRLGVSGLLRPEAKSPFARYPSASQARAPASRSMMSRATRRG